MALITYADKQAMGTQPSIPEVNKITDSNMNEIKDAVNSLEPVTLYDNASGSNSTITLSDSVANYNFIEIYFKSDDGFVKSTKIFGDTAYAELTIIQPLTSAENGMYIKTRIVTLNATTISTTRDGNNNYLAKTMYVTTSGTAQLDVNYIYITKVLGYK